MQLVSRRALALLLALLELGQPAIGAEIDKYLPNDTESVVTINVRQTLNSRLFKQHALEHLKRKLKNSDEVQKLLQELNFDPLGDVGELHPV